MPCRSSRGGWSSSTAAWSRAGNDEGGDDPRREDDPKTAELVRLYRVNAGFEVRLAADGASALPAAREAPADLVVLDWMLPRASGISLCRALRLESDVPVILLTARAGEEDRLRGLDTSADEYVGEACAWATSHDAARGPAPGSVLSGWFGFAGGSPGNNAVMLMNFDSGTTIVVLSNLDPPSAETVAQKIRGWLPK